MHYESKAGKPLVAALKLKSIAQIYRLVEHNCFILTHLTAKKEKKKKTMTPKITRKIHLDKFINFSYLELFFCFFFSFFFEKKYWLYTPPSGRKQILKKTVSRCWYRMQKFPFNEETAILERWQIDTHNLWKHCYRA